MTVLLCSVIRMYITEIRVPSSQYRITIIPLIDKCQQVGAGGSSLKVSAVGPIGPLVHLSGGGVLSDRLTFSLL